MHNHPPAASTAETEFAAFVAIDWADQKHCWKLQSADARIRNGGELINTPEAIDVWAAELNQQFPGGRIAVALEQKRGAVISTLLKYAHLILYPVHGATLANFRQAFFPSGSKGDPGDTGLLLEILLQHRDRLHPLKPDTAQTRELQMLVELRRREVDERTRLSNRLTDYLKIHFPQALQLIDDIDSPMGLDLLDRWPTLEQLQRVKPNHLSRFFAAHNCRSETRIQERINTIYAAVPATTDPATLNFGKAAVKATVPLLRALNAIIAELDQQIRDVMATHPEAGLFDKLPGAGPVLAPRLVAAFGTQRDRWTSASDLQAYSGIAPVKRQSGNSSTIQFRRACPKFLRQTFHEFAQHSIAKSSWARAYYDVQRRDKKKGHHCAVRALAFKWIRVLFRCWKDHVPYDEATYGAALRRSHSQLAGILPANTRAGWKNVAGFQKFSEENS